MRTHRILIGIMACLLGWQAGHLHADTLAQWQWSVRLEGSYSKETQGEAEAFLWIPPTCQRLQALVFSQQNMNDETLFRSALFRAEMERLGVGLLWVAPGISQDWSPESGAQALLDACLGRLAAISGYDELATVPLVPFGHSAMATFPWNFAAWNRERTLAVLSYHGDAPRTNLCGYGRANVEWGRTRNIDRVPGLMVEGEFEWWEARVNPALAFRMMYPQSRISFLCDAGRGHFDLCDETIRYLVRFIEKSLAYYPDRDTNPDPGWLAERWRGDQRRPKPAPAQTYRGDRHDAFWYFDREMAEWAERRYAETRGKEPQYVTFAQDGRLLPYDRNQHVKVQTAFRPEADGVSFHLRAVATDSTRCRTAAPAAGRAPRISVVSGPAMQVNDTTFRLNFYCTGLSNPGRWGICLVAEADGDARHKSAVQEMTVRVPLRLTEGRRQSILFPSLPDVKAAPGTRIALPATTDSGLPVYYYVKAGPALVEGSELVITSIPPRAKRPVCVTVGAWQYGIPGQVQSADPVERSFWLTD